MVKATSTKETSPASTTGSRIKYKNIFAVKSVGEKNVSPDVMTFAIEEQQFIKFLNIRLASPYNRMKNLNNYRAIRKLYGVHEPTREGAILLRERMQGAGKAPDTIRIYIATMRLWAECKGQPLPKDDKMLVVKIPEKKRTPVPYNDISKIIAACDNERDAAIIALMTYCCLRRGEVVNLRLTDIDLRSRILIVQDHSDEDGTDNTKTGMREVPIPQNAVQILNRWLNVRATYCSVKKHNTSFFIISNTGRQMGRDSINVILRRLEKKIGLEYHIHPHKFRRTGLTFLGNNPEIPAYQIQQIAGHKDFKTTEKYLSTTANQLRASIDKIKYF